MPDVQLIYISETVKLLTEAQLDELTLKSQMHNSVHDLSGVLLYGHGHFLQVLEGRLHAVNSLYVKIQKDRRHKNVNLLSFVPIRQRHFAAWNMKLLTTAKSRDLDPVPFRRALLQFEERSLTQMGDFGKEVQAIIREFELLMAEPSVKSS